MRPEIICRFWYSIDWDVESIWALELPHSTLPIDMLMWHMAVPVWPDAYGPYRVTPSEVLKAPELFTAEYQRIQSADLSYPLDILFRGDRWMILDGCHRLARSVELGHVSVNVRKVPESAVSWLS